MDRLEALGTQLSQITMYDIKSMYNQAKNVVLNVSEIEAKVREATNDEPWGASSTLMQDIANRTFNYPDFNEIMPSIYARFMEKEARQWRQIYKALQLLEYLVKNGSERVVDDARSHVSTIKMLRNFHYIDDKGKDEGLNVRNRAKEIVELLSDVDKIRTERRKAKANKSKYTGAGSDGLSFSSGGGRYGGFGSESMGYGGSGGGGGGGGGYGAESSSDYYQSGGSSAMGASSSGGFRDDRRPGAFEEYNAGDDEIGARTSSPVNTRSAPVRKASVPIPAPPPAAAPQPIVNLLDDDDFAAPPPVAPKAAPAAAPAPSNVFDDDDFADFQAAPVSPVVPAAAPVAAKPNLMDMLNSAPAVQPQRMSMGMGMGSAMQPSAPRYGTPMNSTPMTSTPIAPNYTGMSAARAPAAAAAPAKPAAASSNFDDLWSMSFGSTTSKPATPTAGPGKSMKDLGKEKADAGLWGSKPATANTNTGAGAFGAFGTGAPASSASNDLDDLLG
ncbi:unnamed protein product [Mycena citricolor]|uniref:ENTH domain-containing protein n=1 Tax=Mycena citricolor TaxID=2018698 RepID=A0AAD2Q7F2_9AGAR|nr:unnamed protein product [Mycena citricolor]